MNKFRKLQQPDHLELYKKLKTEFKCLCERKKTEFQEKRRIKLVSCASINDLWSHMNLFKEKKASNNIKPSQWYDHFYNLLNECKQEVDEDFANHVSETLKNHNEAKCELCQSNPLNDPITQKEIEIAVKSLNSGKAPGPDGLVSEVYKCLLKDLVPYLEILFNMILPTGEFPASWSKSILTPIYKKGDRHNPKNYRGISLIDVMGKVFTKILNSRIVHWAEINNRFSEAQCGYRQGRSTIDHVFSLMGIIQKYISKKKGRLYCLYIDFSAAFDSVRHDMLWYVLMKLGLHGNILKGCYSQCIKNLTLLF